MSKKKGFALRLDPEVYDALRVWADDELRSINAQIEFLLARALKEAGRTPRGRRTPREGPKAPPGDPEKPPASSE